MKQLLSLVVVTVMCLSVSAQKTKTKSKSTTRAKATWTRSFDLSVYAGQAGGKNWASGGESFSLAENAFLNGFINRKAGRWYWNNSIIASFGMINSNSAGFRKNDDKMDYYSTLGLSMKKKTNLAYAAAFNFRSQFWKGYDHDYLNQGIKRRTSGFFAPAYITIAPVGVELAPTKLNAKGSFNAFAGLAARATIVSNAPYSYAYQGGVIPANLVNEKNQASTERSVAEMYGVDPNKTIRYQGGPYIAATYTKQIVKNVTLMGRFDALSDFYNNEGANIDLFMTNTFSLKVNNWLSAVYSIDVAYDDNVRKFGYFKNKTGTQVKSILGVGITAKLK